MRILIMVGVALVCATVITGCGGGGQHEKIVRELYVALQSGDFGKIDKFAKENFQEGLDDILKENRRLKKNIRAISESNAAVKTKTIKELEDDLAKGAIVEAECDGITLYFMIVNEKGKSDKIAFITDDLSSLISLMGDIPSESNVVKETRPKASNDLDLFAQKGQRLFAAIVKANVEREACGLNSVWPRSKDDPENDDDVGYQAFKNLGTYFQALFDVPNKGTETWAPYVSDVDVSDAIDSQKALWNIALDISDEMSDDAPIMISSNFDCNNITDIFMSDVDKVIPIGDVPILGNKGVVVVYKSGKVAKLSADKVTLKNILKCTFYAIPNCSWLTPSGVAKMQTVSHFPELELKYYNALAKSIMRMVGGWKNNDAVISVAIKSVRDGIKDVQAELIKSDSEEQKVMLETMLKMLQ